MLRTQQSPPARLDTSNKRCPLCALKPAGVVQVSPHQMAIAAGDASVRVFDRRRMSLGEPFLCLAVCWSVDIKARLAHRV